MKWLLILLFIPLTLNAQWRDTMIVHKTDTTLPNISHIAKTVTQVAKQAKNRYNLYICEQRGHVWDNSVWSWISRDYTVDTVIDQRNRSIYLKIHEENSDSAFCRRCGAVISTTSTKGRYKEVWRKDD